MSAAWANNPTRIACCLSLALFLAAQQRAFPSLTPAGEANRAADAPETAGTDANQPAPPAESTTPNQPASPGTKPAKPPLSLLAALPTEIAPRPAAPLDSRSIRELLGRDDGVAKLGAPGGSHGWASVPAATLWSESAAAHSSAGLASSGQSTSLDARQRHRAALLTSIASNAPPRA